MQIKQDGYKSKKITRKQRKKLVRETQIETKNHLQRPPHSWSKQTQNNAQINIKQLKLKIIGWN